VIFLASDFEELFSEALPSEGFFDTILLRGGAGGGVPGVFLPVLPVTAGATVPFFFGALSVAAGLAGSALLGVAILGAFLGGWGTAAAELAGATFLGGCGAAFLEAGCLAGAGLPAVLALGARPAVAAV
jgi:hypothetical protein